MRRMDAIARTLTTLRFFDASVQSADVDATGYKGFYYHFLEMVSGRRVWKCELSTIGSAILLAGMLTAAAYFSGEDEDEPKSERFRRALPARGLELGAKRRRHGDPCLEARERFSPLPLAGLLRGDDSMSGRLGLADPSAASRNLGAMDLHIPLKNHLRSRASYAGPLFIHQFSHIWIDFRGIQDDYMHGKRIDYFGNSRRDLCPSTVCDRQTSSIRRLRRKLLGNYRE